MFNKSHRFITKKFTSCRNKRWTITGGELKINKADKEFTLKDGDIYTCTKGKTDMNTNTSKGVVVMRAAILIPA